MVFVRNEKDRSKINGSIRSLTGIKFVFFSYEIIIIPKKAKIGKNTKIDFSKIVPDEFLASVKCSESGMRDCRHPRRRCSLQWRRTTAGLGTRCTNLDEES